MTQTNFVQVNNPEEPKVVLKDVSVQAKAQSYNRNQITQTFNKKLKNKAIATVERRLSEQVTQTQQVSTSDAETMPEVYISQIQGTQTRIIDMVDDATDIFDLL